MFQGVQKVTQLTGVEGTSLYLCKDTVLVFIGFQNQGSATIDAAIASLPTVGRETGDTGNGPLFEIERLFPRQLGCAFHVDRDTHNLNGQTLKTDSHNQFNGKWRNVYSHPVEPKFMCSSDSCATAAERVENNIPFPW